MKWSFKIGSILGIPVKVHVTFVLLLLLIYFAGTPILGVGGMSGVIFVVLVFASVVFHELSHSMAARHFGIQVVDITLLPIGGVARIENYPERPSQEILIAAAGPAASFFLAFLLWFGTGIFGTEVTVSDLSIRSSLLAQLTVVNFVLGVFNLLPAFPMDGGRILRGVLGLYLRPFTATRIAVGVGQAFAIGLFFLGLFSMNPFTILIALFVYLGAETEERQMGIMLSLGHATARAAMITSLETLTPQHTIGDAAELYFRTFQSDFPVMDEQRLVGIVTRELLTETLHKRGPSVPVVEAMTTDFPVALPETPLIDVLYKIQLSESKAVPIMKSGHLEGLITLEQIGRYNMLCSGYSCEFLESTKTR
ncbi:MAG: site-2 protease family protein [Deltaproteobacteria bacterium]|nr:site-2 protease family protein [Deltaproteobacteria bacterium]